MGRNSSCFPASVLNSLSMAPLGVRARRAFWPMRPKEISRGQREAEPDDDVEVVKVFPQLIPPFSHRDPDIRQGIAPWQRSNEGEEDEARKVHTGDARRQ